MDSLDGFLVVNKPKGPSSFDIIRKLRRILNTKKIGHHGTLDPMAEGVLIIAVGRATKLLNYLPDGDKCYEFEATFGKATDTLDSEGLFVKESENIPTEDDIKSLIPFFIGDVEQTPPQFSAVKIAGTPAYKLARSGKKVDIEPRIVHIEDLKLLQFNENRAHFIVNCSRGTYVRVLTTQIAEKVNSCAYTSMIKRVRSGLFSIDSAVSLSDDTLKSDIKLNTARDILKNLYPEISVGDNIKKELSFGRDIEIDSDAEVIFIYSDSNSFPIAVARHIDGKKFHPEKVFL